METKNVRVAVWLPSVTLIVKLNCPLAVGVPLNVPLKAPSDSPGGRKLKGATDHVRAPAPPVAASVWVYADATLQKGNAELVVIESSELTTLSVNCFTPKLALLLASAALIRNVDAPVVVGDPLRRPVA